MNEISLDGLEDINIDLESEPLETAAKEDAETEPLSPEDWGTEETLELNLATENDNFADDSLIPEGFEANAVEAPAPFDDDLEVTFGEEDLTPLDIPEETTEPLIDTKAEAADVEAGPAVEENLDIPAGLKNELKTVLSYMDHLLESLPEEKIEEFAKSEYFDTYKKLFKELGLV